MEEEGRFAMKEQSPFIQPLLASSHCWDMLQLSAFLDFSEVIKMIPSRVCSPSGQKVVGII